MSPLLLPRAACQHRPLSVTWLPSVGPPGCGKDFSSTHWQLKVERSRSAPCAVKLFASFSSGDTDDCENAAAELFDSQGGAQRAGR